MHGRSLKSHPPSSNHDPAGVSQAERIVTLDVLRGLALFGMILVYFHQRMEIPTTGLEDVVGWIVWMGIETKAWAIFALLFGAGFAILMRRLEARHQNVVPLFLRRMLALAVIGGAVEVFTGSAYSSSTRSGVFRFSSCATSQLLRYSFSPCAAR